MQLKNIFTTVVLSTIILNLAVFGQQKTTFKQIATEYISFETLVAINEGKGAPIAFPKSMVTDDINIANDLTNFIGRIVRLAKGDSSIAEFLQSIVADTAVVKLHVPASPKVDYKKVDNTKLTEISFFGNLSLKKHEIYEYNSTTSYFASVLDKQIDRSKIPQFAKCLNPNDCDYYYIIAGSVQTCTLQLLSEIKKNVRVSKLPLPGILSEFGTNVYVGDTQTSKKVRNFVFLTIVKVPS